MVERHGLSGTPEYRAWYSMNKRCYDTGSDKFKWYGARGIKVSEEWRRSFLAFYKELGDKPEPKSKYSLERIDNNEGYTPKNCKWATRGEQANNTRYCKFIEYYGVTETLTTWCRILEIPYSRTRERINTLKWPVEKAFETPYHKRKRR